MSIPSQNIQPIIDYASGILSRPPQPQSAMDTSAWFVTETMEVKVGETIGRPSKEVQLSRDFVTYLLANGWYITAFTEGEEGGEWQSVATSNVTNATSSTSASGAKSNAQFRSTSTAERDGGSATTGTTEGFSEGEQTSSGSTSTAGSSTTSVNNAGAPYWYAYNTVRLARRRIQAERVLNDMVQTFTDAYNEGREMNNERYDELVACYLLLLQETKAKTDLFADLDTSDFKPLADRVTDAIKNAMEEYKNSVGTLPDDWMQSRIDEINRKFDALLAEAMQKMVTAGTYNSTVWPTTASGIERDRQNALNALKDDMVTLKVEVMGRIASMTADVGQKLLDCGIRIIEARQKLLIGPVELYNTVVKWMLDFMERRDDDYPSLESLVTVADKLGYADGASSSGASGG